MKFIIVDDELSNINSLKHLIESYYPELEFENSFQDADDAISFLNTATVDLVFLDINMPRTNGFQILHTFQNRQFQVIIVTASDRHAIKAIKYHVTDYIIKPVQINELSSAINHFKNNLVTKRSNAAKEKLSITNSGGTTILNIDDIVYIQGIDNLCKIQLNNGKSISLSKILKHFEDTLDNRFYRIHKSYIVNKDYINKINNLENKQLLLKDGTTLPISRRNYKDFMDTLEMYISNKSSKF